MLVSETGVLVVVNGQGGRSKLNETHANSAPPSRKLWPSTPPTPKSVKTVTNCPKIIFWLAMPTPEAIAAKMAIPRSTYSTGPA